SETSQPHAQTLPPTYPALSLCSLHFPNTHTHTQAQDHYLALPIQEHYIFFCTLHTSSTRSLFIFLLDTDTVKIIALCTIGPVSGNTLCENVLPMCMHICSPYVYVYVIYVCMFVS